MKKILFIAVSVFSHLAQAIAEIEENDSQDLIDDPNYKKYIDKLIERMHTQESLSLAEQRKLDDQIAVAENKCYELVQRIEDIAILGQEYHAIPVRLYYPSQSKELPILVFFHGGGWVYGSIARADAACRRFANHLNCIVASVEYRLAPENPFPKPLEDCYTALEWISNNAKNLGGNASKIIVCGESAGGNLAAATAMLARDRNGPHLLAQLLINPVITSTIKNEPYDHCSDRFFLTKDLMKYFWNMYLQTPEDYDNPYASPEKAKEHSNLPPAIVVTAEHDPLRLEAEDYAKKLQNSGVQVFIKNFPKVIHGFMTISLYEENEKVEWTKKINELLFKMNIF